jgi:AhpD family alkylhydroperoxidase
LAGIQALLALGKVLNASGLEPSLRELVKIPASQLNGSACCIDMHRDAREKDGAQLARTMVAVVPG